AERTLAHHLTQLQRSGAEAMLQHHAERDAGLARGVHQLDSAVSRHLERLLEQDVLAGRSTLAHQIKVRVGRREDFDAVDRWVGQDGVETVCERKRELLRKGLAPRLAR